MMGHACTHIGELLLRTGIGQKARRSEAGGHQDRGHQQRTLKRFPQQNLRGKRMQTEVCYMT